MNAQSQTQAILPLTRITFFLSVFVMAWGLFVFTHVWVVVFFGIPIAFGILVILLIGEALAVWTGRRIVISKRVTNRLSILLIAGALLSPGVGFLIGYVQVQMILYGTGIDAQMLWQETTLLSQWSDISPTRQIQAEYRLTEDPAKSQIRVSEWVKDRLDNWKSESISPDEHYWTCKLPNYGEAGYIRIRNDLIKIWLEYNVAWKCMLPS